MKDKIVNRKLFSKKRLKWLGGCLGVLTVLLFLALAIFPKIMAGNTVVNDLIVQATSNEKIINVVVTDQNESDTKVILPLPEGVTYQSNGQQIVGVTEDSANHQLVIDWVEGQVKQVNLQFEAKQAGKYDFVVNTVRDNQPVSSVVSTVEIKTIPSSSTSSSEVPTSNLSTIEPSSDGGNDKGSENAQVPSSTSEKLADSPVSIHVQRVEDGDQALSGTPGAAPDSDVTHLFDNVTGVRGSAGSTGWLKLKVETNSSETDKGNISLILPKGTYMLKDDGSTASAISIPLVPISNGMDLVGGSYDYDYDASSRTLTIKNVDLTKESEILFLRVGFSGVLSYGEKSKEIDIPITWSSTEEKGESVTDNTLTFFSFAEMSEYDTTVRGDNNEVLSPDSKGVISIPANQKQLSLTGTYNPYGGIASGTPDVAKILDSVGNLKGKYQTKTFWSYPQSRFNSVDLTTGYSNTDFDMNEKLLNGKSDGRWVLDNECYNNFAVEGMGKITGPDGEIVLPIFYRYTMQNVPSTMKMSTDTQKWPFDSVYEVKFGYELHSYIPDTQFGQIIKSSLKFTRKRPNPIVNQSISSENKVKDGKNYIGDKISNTINLENTINDSIMKDSTQTINIPSSLEVDQKSIQVLDSTGKLVSNVSIKYQSGTTDNEIIITGEGLNLSPSNKLKVVYEVEAKMAGNFETTSNLSFLNSYGEPQPGSVVDNKIEVENIDPWNNDFDLRPEDTTKFDTSNGDYPALTTLTKGEKTPMIYKVSNTKAPRDETLTQFDMWLTDVNWKNDFEVDKSSFYIKQSTTSDWEKVAESKIDDTTSIGDKTSYTIKDIDLILSKGETIEIKFSITAKSTMAIKKNAIAAQGTIKESGSLSSLNSLVVKSGELRFETVPDTLSFEDSKISNRTLEAKRKDKDWEMIVEDTRLDKKAWRITAKLAAPFKDSSGVALKNSILLFRETDQEDQWIDSNSETDVFDGTSSTEDYYNVSWSEKEGPLIQVAPGTVKVGQYKGTVEWNLIDAPA